MKFSTIKLRATNDENGNPRRLFATLCEGILLALYDEGYNGIAAITDSDHREAYNGFILDISVKQYKAFINGFYNIQGLTDENV